MFYVFNFYNFSSITNFAVAALPVGVHLTILHRKSPLPDNRIMLICNPQIYNFYEIFHLFIIQRFSF